MFLTFYPVEAYRDYQYYHKNNKYERAYVANIVDSKYQTQCYASFDAVYVEQDGGYQKYYYRSATAIFLFGLATFVTMRRKVICMDCNGETDDHYRAAEDESRSIEDGNESIFTKA